MKIKQHGLVGRKSNNPDGRTPKNGPTESISVRIPIEVLNKIAKRTQNRNEFIVDAVKSKLKKPD